MNLKTTFLASLSVALLAITANAEVIHESDFEAESTTGFGIVSETMGFTDAGGDLIGFTMNNNTESSGLAVGISDANPLSGSFHYAVDASQTTMAGNGWGGSWNGQNTEGGSGGFTTPAAAIANGDGCYIDFVAGATFTVTAMVATDAANPLTGNANAEVRLEFNNIVDNGDGTTTTNPDVIVRQFSPSLGAADLTSTYQPITVSYTLTAADIAAATAPINSVVGVMGTNNHNGAGTDTGMIYFDDFKFEVDSASVVVVGNGHTSTVLKGDVDLDGSVTFLDINPFIVLLAANGFQAEADCDCDGDLDFLDIQPFIDILAGN